MATVAVIGGGISGISAAYYLSKPAYAHLIKRIVLLEASPKFGGWMQTSVLSDGSRMEHGPRSIRGYGDAGVNTLQLVEELGLEDSILPINNKHPASTNRFLYVNKKLCPLPKDLRSVLFKQEPFSISMASTFFREPKQPRSSEQDESIHSFISRRLGTELAEYAVDPLCRGIFAGDCRQLSIKSCFPDLHAFEQEHGGIIRGMVHKMRAPKPPTPTSPLLNKFNDNKWQVWSLKEGLGQLVGRMVSELESRPNVELHLATPCTGINLKEGKAQVTTSSFYLDADSVFSCCYSKHLASLLNPEHHVLSSELNGIPAVTVGVVTLQYPGKVLPVTGFGHLVPSCEPSKVLGVIYESCLFPSHDGKDDTTRLTCMMGGAWFEEHFGDEDKVETSTLTQVAIESVREQLQISQEPLRALSHLHKACIPQYLVGHSERLAFMDDYIDNNALPLKLVGSSYKGPSVNDCIKNARLEVEKYQAKLL